MHQELASNDWFTQPNSQIPIQPDSSDFFEEESSLFDLSPTFLLIPVFGTHSSELHKQEAAPASTNQSSDIQNFQNGATLTSNGLTGQPDPTPPFQHPDGDSNQPRRKKAIKKASKRKDDNNNAHKKFITVQNSVLTELHMLHVIKKGLKKAGMKFDKGSRHSFMTRMIDTKVLFNDKFHSFKTKFIAKIGKTFKPSDDPAEALLHSLVDYYTRSCELFTEGREEKATEILYDLPEAKEEKYKEAGILKVRNYRKQRFP